MSTESHDHSRARRAPRWLLACTVAVLCYGVVHASQPADAPDRVLEGEVTVDIRGLGAAPLGIASAVFGSMAIAYNLGRFEETRGTVEPVNPIPLPGLEVYKGSLRFTLEPRGRHRWSARSFALQYSFHDSSRFARDEVVISDSLDAGGEARWRAVRGNTRRAGMWEAPPGWRPGFRPRIELRTFEAPSVEDCEDPGWAVTRALRTALTPAEQRVTCYELEIFVAHPVEATGSSVWTSPIGEVGLVAQDGVYRFSGSSAAGELAKSAASMPLPPGTPPETVQAIRTMGELASIVERLLGGGLPEIDLDTPFTWERTYRGQLRNDSVMVRETYPILTGATVYETARVGEGPIVDIYRDGSRVTGRTIDAVVGERLNLEGAVEMADGPVGAWRWDVPGDPVERFHVTWSEKKERAKDCEGKEVTETVRTPVNGRPDRLEAGERAAQSVSFLWWEEGRYRVVLGATVGGRTEEAEVTFKVAKPEIVVHTDTGDSPFRGITPVVALNPCGQPLPEDTQLVVTGGEIPKAGGVVPYAIRIWHDELPGKYPGETQYVQLVKEDGTWLLRPEVAFGPDFCLEEHTAFMLDTSYPYPGSPQMTDWPGIPLGTRNRHRMIENTMAFQTWLMYRPRKSDADWAPLRIVDWSWKGGVTWNPDRLEYDPEGPRVRVTSERSADGYPEWRAVARGGQEHWEPVECPPE